MTEQTLILGGPGTGKTTSLLDQVDACLAAGVPPNEIAFVTFTRAAATEAKQRASKRFSLPYESMPYFRTIHSLCFHGTYARRQEMLKREHLSELSKLTGEDFPWQDENLDEGIPDPDAVTGEHLLHFEQLARVTRSGLREIWQTFGAEVDWFRLKRFADAYARFKQDNGLIDFTDLLERYCATGHPFPVRVAFVDEGQDLTALQWGTVGKAFRNVQQLFVGGDDDQSIHEWAGAAVPHFLSLPYRQKHLGLSHRLPEPILEVGKRISSRMQRRFPKPLEPTGRVGHVHYLKHVDHAPVEDGEWLVLARTRHMARELGRQMEYRGIIYSTRGRSSVEPEHARAINAFETMRAGKLALYDDAILAVAALPARLVVPYREYIGASDIAGFPMERIWHDALTNIPLTKREYYLACRRRGEKLLQAPRVRVETIHGSKGLEAPNVLLCTDITERIERGMELWPDAEHRVFYVGATRARENLYVVEPQGSRGYGV